MNDYKRAIWDYANRTGLSFHAARQHIDEVINSNTLKEDELTISQAAGYLGCKEYTIRRGIKGGKLESRKLPGGQVVVTTSALDRYNQLLSDRGRMGRPEPKSDRDDDRRDQIVVIADEIDEEMARCSTHYPIGSIERIAVARARASYGLPTFHPGDSTKQQR